MLLQLKALLFPRNILKQDFLIKCGKVKQT
jgi:hypothetical protein